jgi:hypothetical protein
MILEENFKKVETLSLDSSPTEASFFDLKRLIKLLLLLLLLLLLILACLLACLLASDHDVFDSDLFMSELNKY